MFYRGDRVKTPMGMGTVAYQRMAPPEFKQPAAVSIALDDRRNEPNYTGTVFRAEEIGQVELLSDGEVTQA